MEEAFKIRARSKAKVAGQVGRPPRERGRSSWSRFIEKKHKVNSTSVNSAKIANLRLSRHSHTKVADGGIEREGGTSFQR